MSAPHGVKHVTYWLVPKHPVTDTAVVVKTWSFEAGEIRFEHPLEIFVPVDELGLADDLDAATKQTLLSAQQSIDVFAFGTLVANGEANRLHSTPIGHTPTE
jgi:hypothetical protein